MRPFSTALRVLKCDGLDPVVTRGRDRGCHQGSAPCAPEHGYAGEAQCAGSEPLRVRHQLCRRDRIFGRQGETHDVPKSVR